VPNKQDLDLPMKTHVPSFKNQMAKRMIQTLSNNKEEEDIKTSFLVASIKKEMEKKKEEQSLQEASR
jgi:CRISPR/Cas system endoribonuclease Cas6 (RAMP superfamily)